MGSRDHVTRKTIAMICQSGLIFSFLFFNVYANDNWNDCRYGLKLFRKEHLRDPIDFEFDKWTDKNVQIKSIKNTMDCCFKIQRVFAFFKTNKNECESIPRSRECDLKPSID